MIDDELVGTSFTDEYGEVVLDDGRTAMSCPECGKQVLFCSGWRKNRHGGRFKGHYLKCSDRKKCGWKSYDGKRIPPPKNINIITKEGGE